MRTNMTLAVAMAATLSMANSAYSGTLTNLTDSTCYGKIAPSSGVGTAAPCTTEPALVNTSSVKHRIGTDGITVDGNIIGTGLTTGGYVPTSTSTNPLVYGTHLFGASSSGVILPTDFDASTKTAAVAKYTIEGSLGFTFDFKVSLNNNAKFEGVPEIVLDTAETPFWDTSGVNVSTSSSAKADSNSYSWTVDIAENKKLKDGEAFYVIYKITNAQVLQTAGELIEMTARLGSAFTVIDEQTVPVATSAEPLSMLLEKCNSSRIRVSVASGNTELDSKDITDELLSQYSAFIGYLNLANVPGVMGDTGLHQWDLGGAAAAFKAGYTDDGTNTNLTITDGQFAASISETDATVKGKVSLYDPQAGTEITEAEQVTQTEATFELSDSDLNSIVSVGKVAIMMTADGKTPINIEENPPTAKLVLDYQETASKQDIEYPSAEMCKFRQDGTSCYVYGVPPVAANDILNVRITNDSSIAGEIKGTLYDMDGSQVFSNVKLHNTVNGLYADQVEKGQTIRLTSADIANKLEGGPYSWNNRGTLHITSTLPRLEIMTLLRYDVVPVYAGTTLPVSPRMLTNMSTGAHGVACQN